MPNWNMNILNIKGSKKNVDKVLGFIKGDEEGVKTDFDFNKVVPAHPDLYAVQVPQSTPEDIAKAKVNLEKYGFKDWYDFCPVKWGTKWNAGDPSVNRLSDTEAEIGFNTAWSPPTPVIEALGKKFPTLKFELTYCEPGMVFAGVCHVKNGDVEDIDYTGEKYKEIAEIFGCNYEEIV